MISLSDALAPIHGRFSVLLAIFAFLNEGEADLGLQARAVSSTIRAVCHSSRCCGDPGGPLAMIGSEPRQARKGATVVTESCAEVWLSGLPPLRI